MEIKTGTSAFNFSEISQRKVWGFGKVEVRRQHIFCRKRIMPFAESPDGLGFSGQKALKIKTEKVARFHLVIPS